MVDFKYADLYLKDSVDKQLKIQFEGGTITNAKLHQGQFELVESLCSEEQLRFGSCESSSIKFKTSNIYGQLSGIRMTVSETLDGNTDVSFLFGKYKVNSDKPTADRRYRDIIAYDSMHDILNTEVSAWYNTILPNTDSTVTLKEFRDSFITYFGLEQEEVTLVNDSMIVTKTIEPSQLSGKTVITSICEINGCFGHIGRDGKFHYVFLPKMVEGSYPEKGLPYISAKYEDFTTAFITKLQIRQEENDIGCIYGTGDNCYIVQDNFLLYGKSTEELNAVAKNMFSVIKDVWYCPAHVEAKGNPCLEVGDAIRIQTNNTEIYTYILRRTLKGIQALRDTYDAEGEQYQKQKVNSVHESIIQLKGKTNTLKRTIEETKLTITDVEKGLKSQIVHNANGLASEIQRATLAEGDLSNRIKQTANEFSVEVKSLQDQIDGNIITYNVDHVPTLYNYPSWDWTTNIPCNNTVQLSEELEFEYTEEDYKAHARSVVFNTNTFVTYRFLKQNNTWHWVEIADSEYSYVLQQISELKITDTSIETYVKELEEEMIGDYITKMETQSIISQTAESITSTVSATYETKDSASSKYETLSSSIKQTAESISTKVSKGSVISEINQTAEAVKIKAQKIDLIGIVNAEEFITKYATLENLLSTNARVQNLEADHVSVSSLNAVNAKFNSLNADKITAGTLSVDRLDINGIIGKFSGKTIECYTLSANTVRASNFALYNGSGYTNLGTHLIIYGGVRYHLLGYRE